MENFMTLNYFYKVPQSELLQYKEMVRIDLRSNQRRALITETWAIQSFIASLISLDLLKIWPHAEFISLNC
jgi:hypothetical protein